MKIPWTSVAIMATIISLAVIRVNASPPSYESKSADLWSFDIEGDVKERLNQIEFPFEVQVNGQVMNQIKRYVITGRRDIAHRASAPQACRHRKEGTSRI